MSLAPLPPDSYGALTPTFERILATSRAGRWFNAPATAPGRDVQDLLEELRRLAAPPGTTTLPPVEVVRSGHQGLRALLAKAGFDPERPSDPWRPGPTLRLARRLAEVRDAPWFQARIVPPLWPVPGQPTICITLVAERDRLATLTPDTDFQDTLWPLLCQTEFDIWHSLRWHATGLPPQEDLFEPLLRLQAAGFFPVGLLDGRLVLWTLAPPVGTP